MGGGEIYEARLQGRVVLSKSVGRDDDGVWSDKVVNL